MITRRRLDRPIRTPPGERLDLAYIPGWDGAAVVKISETSVAAERDQLAVSGQRLMAAAGQIQWLPTELSLPTDPDSRAVLDRQVQVMLVLAEEVLADLTLDECLWQSRPNSWTVRERNGRWFGELHDEPPDLPTPSLGWTMWHPVWWLGTLLAHTRNEVVPDVTSVEWPGPEMTLPVLRSLWSDWTQCLDALDEHEIRSGDLTRFPYDDRRPFVYVAGWASMEMTKNLAEMCLLRRVATDQKRR